MRVLLGFLEVSGYYKYLRAGFLELGIPCDFINLHPDWRAYGGDDVPTFLVRWIRWTFSEVHVGPSRLVTKIIFTVLEHILGVLFLIWSLTKYDVYIFGFAQSFLSGTRFLRYWDLPVLRWFGKTIIFVFHGSDSRPGYISNSFMRNIFNTVDRETAVGEIRKQKLTIRKIEKYAHFVVSHPPAAHFFEKPIIQWLCLGTPFGPEDRPGTVSTSAEKNEQIRILHAPSSTDAKCTQEIQRMIKALRSNGYPIEFMVVSGQPNFKILEILDRCDFVVDELYSDSPLGGLVTEAAFHGKPSIVGGYYASQIARDVPDEFIPPTKFCLPDDMPRAIEDLVKNREHRECLGRKAREYVAQACSATEVARRYLRIINGDVPASWFFDPHRLRYLHGCGLSEQKAKALLCAVLECGGKAALQIGDKPELEELFIQFSQGGVDEA